MEYYINLLNNDLGFCKSTEKLMNHLLRYYLSTRVELWDESMLM